MLKGRKTEIKPNQTTINKEVLLAFCVINFTVPDLRVSTTGLRTSNNLRLPALQDNCAPEKISSSNEEKILLINLQGQNFKSGGLHFFSFFYL